MEKKHNLTKSRQSVASRSAPGSVTRDPCFPSPWRILTQRNSPREASGDLWGEEREELYGQKQGECLALILEWK